MGSIMPEADLAFYGSLNQLTLIILYHDKHGGST